MSAGNDQLARAVEEAAQEGGIAGPTGLLTLISKLEDPIQALLNNDRANELFGAFDAEFRFLRFSFLPGLPISTTQIAAADQRRYASLIRWLIRELTSWRTADDPLRRRLVAVFVVAQACDCDNGLWSLLPDEIGANTDLLDYLTGLIASFGVTFGRPAEAPIWETEAVSEFEKADAQGDWVSVIRAWPQFRNQLFFVNVLQIQAVRPLYRYRVARLVEGVANLRQTLIAMQLAVVLNIEQRLRLATATENPRIQIAIIYRTLTDDRRSKALTGAETDLLKGLLLKIAGDAPRWTAFMKAFVGYAAIQVSLGRALAEGPESVIEGYIDAIQLSPRLINFGGTRSLVAECLREFRAHASPQRCKVLWTRAYERWSNWNFNLVDSGQHHLTTIYRTDLDYAIVGYASECMDEAERQAAMNAIRAEAQLLEHRWYGSFANILDDWYRLVSKFQLYGYATYVAANGGDWLTEERIFFLFEPSQNKYILMMYNMTWPPTVIGHA
jgi:hypothetical protein